MNRDTLERDYLPPSRNLFKDFGLPNAEVEQLKAILAAQIIKTLDQQRLTVRAAEKLTGISAGDFSRIRNVKLDRFTADRLLTIANKLGPRVQVKLVVARPKAARKAAPRRGKTVKRTAA